MLYQTVMEVSKYEQDSSIMSLPPSEIPLGAIRFNSDSQKLEYWMGSAWMQIQTFSPNLDSGVRGIYGTGGDFPATTNTLFGHLD